nr:LPS export ABC transporter periplasmic protein LptC [uncultured Desulfobacter sp.]
MEKGKRIWGITAVCLILLLCLVLVSEWPDKTDGFKNVYPDAPRKDIVGKLNMSDFRAGRRNFSLSVDSLRVEKKKMGFLRLGFMKIAILDGVEINWFEKGTPESQKEPAGPSVSEDADRFFNQVNKLKQVLPGHIKGVELTRVKINFFKDNQKSFTIRADKASLKSEDQLVLTGHVTINAGNGEKLTCEKIIWLIPKGRFVTSKAFKLDDKTRNSLGHELKTNQGLKNITFSIEEG